MMDTLMPFQLGSSGAVTVLTQESLCRSDDVQAHGSWGQKLVIAKRAKVLRPSGYQKDSAGVFTPSQLIRPCVSPEEADVRSSQTNAGQILCLAVETPDSEGRREILLAC
jgi:hypothetical protein